MFIALHSGTHCFFGWDSQALELLVRNAIAVHDSRGPYQKHGRVHSAFPHTYAVDCLNMHDAAGNCLMSSCRLSQLATTLPTCNVTGRHSKLAR